MSPFSCMQMRKILVQSKYVYCQISGTDSVSLGRNNFVLLSWALLDSQPVRTGTVGSLTYTIREGEVLKRHYKIRQIFRKRKQSVQITSYTELPSLLLGSGSVPSRCSCSGVILALPGEKEVGTWSFYTVNFLFQRQIEKQK